MPPNAKAQLQGVPYYTRLRTAPVSCSDSLGHRLQRGAAPLTRAKTHADAPARFLPNAWHQPPWHALAVRRIPLEVRAQQPLLENDAYDEEDAGDPRCGNASERP